MKRVLFALCLTSALCGSLAAYAQTYAEAEIPMPPPITQRQQLYDHFTRCLNDSSCPEQERLQIMKDVEGEMSQNLQKIADACAEKEFINCIDPQQEEIKLWREAHTRAQQMMQALEVQALSKQEPAAGQPSEATQKKWWNKIWPQRNNK